jgi:hypothetical protein
MELSGQAPRDPQRKGTFRPSMDDADREFVGAMNDGRWEPSAVPTHGASVSVRADFALYALYRATTIDLSYSLGAVLLTG